MPNVNTLAALVRNTVLTASNFSQAVQMLSTSPLIVDVYFTVSGVGPNEGARVCVKVACGRCLTLSL